MDKKPIDLTEVIQHAKDGKLEITILEGKAPEFLSPEKTMARMPLSISGGPGTVYEFLVKRRHLFIPDHCNICVDLSANTIIFVGNEQNDNNDFWTKVSSQSKFTNDFSFAFGAVNTDEDFKPLDLASYLRKRKHLFLDDKGYLTLFTALSSFQAEINRKIEKMDDKSGNVRNSVTQEVIHNIPNKFKIYVEPLQGCGKASFEIEIDIDVDLNCSLHCVTLENTIQNLKRNMLESELDLELEPGIKLKDFCVTWFK